MKPDWKVPGIACRDPNPDRGWNTPETTVWRLVAINSAGVRFWYCLRGGIEIDWQHSNKRKPTVRSMFRAIASGPDFTDLYTVGALRLLMPDRIRPFKLNSQSRWGWLNPGSGLWRDTETESEAIRFTWEHWCI